MRPCVGLDAVAYSLRGSRPAPAASQPDSTASRMACSTCAAVTHAGDLGVEQHAVAAELMAIVTSLAVPTPASAITGYDGSAPFKSSRIMRMLLGLSTLAATDQATGRHDALAAPASLSRRAITGSSLV